ncbi:MAG TPA: phosphoribosylglycinamide formyltransferase [Gemmatimonadaceae bacterium]|nr:phosphoribosylglycinamide formyltransferase [Gemmatimonadaceae bacterium]
MNAAHRARVAVFASGAGSNLAAMLAYLGTLGEQRAADIALVISDRGSAGALERAAERGVRTAVLRDPSDGGEILQLLSGEQVALIALAGYLRLLPAEVVADYRNRVLNVHPAPLPRFGGHGMYGRRVHEAVIAAGVSESGVTVHFVDEEYDRGAVLAHWPVPVVSGDTPESLAQRVLAAEHVVYPRILEMVAALTPPRI